MSDRVSMKIEWDPAVHHSLKMAATERGTSMKRIVQEAVRAHLGVPASAATPAAEPRKEAPWFTDSVAAFVRATCELSPQWSIPARDLRQACAEHLNMPDDTITPVGFGLALSAAYPEVRSRRVRRNGRLIYAYQGIRLRPEGQEIAK